MGCREIDFYRLWLICKAVSSPLLADIAGDVAVFGLGAETLRQLPTASVRLWQVLQAVRPGIFAGPRAVSCRSYKKGQCPPTSIAIEFFVSCGMAFGRFPI
jgi:hypothetical protein